MTLITLIDFCCWLRSNGRPHLSKGWQDDKSLYVSSGKKRSLAFSIQHFPLFSFISSLFRTCFGAKLPLMVFVCYQPEKRNETNDRVGLSGGGKKEEEKAATTFFRHFPVTSRTRYRVESMRRTLRNETKRSWKSRAPKTLIVINKKRIREWDMSELNVWALRRLLSGGVDGFETLKRGFSVSLAGKN